MPRPNTVSIYRPEGPSIRADVRAAMRATPLKHEEINTLADASWRGGPTQRKMLLVIEGEGARIADAEFVRDFETLAGNPGLARIGGAADRLVRILDIIERYDTDTELPTVFVERRDAEIVSIYLYTLP